MKKALHVASVASMIDQFNMENIEVLQELGYEVDVAANFEFGSTSSKERVEAFKKELVDKNISIFNILFNRNIYKFSNIRKYKELKKIIEKNKYEIIHCHSPIGGVLTRLAAKKARNDGTKVIYTAHGFHFYKGASIINWMLFYPIEKFCAKYTDMIITINHEDYNTAQKFKNTRIIYIPGIGVDTNKNVEITREEKRKELNLSNNEFVLLSVGELSKRKNHKVVIEALSKIENKSITYVICGKGELDKYLEEKAKKLNVKLKLLGFRKDVDEIYRIADLFIFPSLQEGLPVALMEAMSHGLPVVCSKIRGNSDLIKNGEGGYLIDAREIDGFAKAIDKIMNIKDLSMGNINKKNIAKFDSRIVIKKMRKIYSE